MLAILILIRETRPEDTPNLLFISKFSSDSGDFSEYW